MFGLTKKEALFNAILNASKNNVGIYKKGIKANIDVLNGDTEAAEEKMISIRREYLDEVANSVINTFAVSSPAIAARIQLVLLSPARCGYDEIDIDNGFMAGSLYAICYYAIMNKVAEPRDCIRLNHLQYEIMNMALSELDCK